MIKTILLTTLYSALRAYIGSGVYDRLAQEVIAFMGVSTLTGAEKMAKVLSFAKAEAITLSEYLLRAVVELVLYRAKAGS